MQEKKRILNENSFVVLYENSYTEDRKIKLGFWCGGFGNVSNELLNISKKDYPNLGIRRMKVSNVLKQTEEKYSYIKGALLEELNAAKAIFYGIL